MELQEEIQALRASLERERNQSQNVTITGPRGHPIYAQASFRDGNYDYSPELWKVEFPPPQLQEQNCGRCCSLSELGDMEVRIGGICKARLANGIVEGFVNDVKNNYDHQQKSGAVSIWFGGSSGIWLNVRIQPIEREQYAALRDFDLGGDNLLSTLLQFFSPNDAWVSYTEVSFLISYINGAMEHWGISSQTSDEEDEEESANER
jgi:hypothetical protein